MKKVKTLIFFLDAVREDYITPEHTPFLWKWKQEQTFLDVTSLLGYSAGIHPTIFTGQYQETHGHFLVYSYTEQNGPFTRMRHLSRLPGKIRKYMLSILKAPYYMIKRGKKLYPKRYKKKILPIPASIDPRMAHCFQTENVEYENIFFKLLEQQGMTYSSQPDYYNPNYGEGVGVDNWSLTDEDLDYYFCYEIDPIGHYHGPCSYAIYEIMNKVDKKLEQLITQAHQQYETCNVFIFSDHGMVEVTNTVNVKEKLDDSDLVPVKDYIAFYDSTMVRFWTQDTQVQQKIITLLADVEHLTYLNNELKETYHVRFQDRKWGDLFFLVDPGYRVFPDYFAPVRFNTKGMHGYWPEAKAGQGVFLTNTFSTKEKTISVVDFMPTMLEAMGRKDLIPDNIAGSSIC